MHILLVEDHDDTRTLVARLLERGDHDVATAGTVADALILMRTFLFDVLVSDIGLPDGSGLQVVTEAKKLPRFKQRIALTAYSSREDRERGLAAGFDHYMSKPVDFAQLRSLLAATA